jgi:hypothetical protein
MDERETMIATASFAAGWDAALDEARAAFSCLEPLLDVEKRNGGYDCCGCTTPGKLLDDALAAIDALRQKP